jgi:hypothetical protein
MNLTRLFEDLEAEAAFEPERDSVVTQMLGAASAARIIVNAEGIVVSNLVFGKGFVMGLSQTGLLLVRLGAIAALEPGTSRLGSFGPLKVGLRLWQWLAENAIGHQIRVCVLGSSQTSIGQLVACENKWLAIERLEGDRFFIATRSIAAVELVPVNKHEGHLVF